MKFNTAKVITVIVLSLIGELVLVGCSKNSSSALAAEISQEVASTKPISSYDEIIKDVAEESDYDWRFLSAIAYAESRFQPQARSHAGALGLMQIMPLVARRKGVNSAEMLDPLTNISLAAEILKTIEKTLRFGNASETEKLKIILAGYNSGIGNLIEARKRAVASGVNHNSWETLKNYGAVNNPETRSFVHKVMNQWEHYKKLHS